MSARASKAKMTCNKPKRTPGHKTKSHVVKACSGGKEKIIRFGQQGVKGSPRWEYRERQDECRLLGQQGEMVIPCHHLSE